MVSLMGRANRGKRANQGGWDARLLCRGTGLRSKRNLICREESTAFDRDGVFLGRPVDVQSGEDLRCIQLAEVRVQEGEPLENALRRFKRKVQTEDIIKEVKRHSFYLKPGEKRRVKEALARKRNRKKARKEAD